MSTRSSGPGSVRVRPGTVTINERPADERATLHVVNTGDRPIQVGSHVHLPDANLALQMDRDAAHGYRLDIPSGTSQRFEPGASRTVPIVTIRGERRVPGLRIRTEAEAQLDG